MRVVRAGAVQGMAAPLPIESVRAVFNKFDTDGSGGIDVHELPEALALLGLTGITQDKVEYVMRTYDADRNSTLGICEFVNLVDDLNLNTSDSMQLRLGLRTHPSVLASLEMWRSTAWRCMEVDYRNERRQQYDGTPNVDVTPATNEVNALKEKDSPEQQSRTAASHSVPPLELSRSQYLLIVGNIVRAMVADVDGADVSQAAEEDWEGDRRGHETLSAELFMDGLFEVLQPSGSTHTHTHTYTHTYTHTRTHTHTHNSLSLTHTPCFHSHTLTGIAPWLCLIPRLDCRSLDSDH